MAVVTVHSQPAATPVADEVQRLAQLAATAMREGLVLAVLTHADTLTGDAQVAVDLCKAIPGLGLTLDPSHFLQGPQPDYDIVFPYVQNVHLRDTGQAPASSRSASARVRSNTPASSTCSSATVTTVR